MSQLEEIRTAVLCLKRTQSLHEAMNFLLTAGQIQTEIENARDRLHDVDLNSAQEKMA